MLVYLDVVWLVYVVDCSLLMMMVAGLGSVRLQLMFSDVMVMAIIGRLKEGSADFLDGNKKVLKSARET